MTEVHFVEKCDAPLEVAFEYLDDYRNVVEYWHGMTSYTPVGDLDHGLGSVYAAVSKIGPSTVKSTLKTIQWEKNALVAYKSTSGMDTSTTFTFSAVDASHSTVELRVEFHLPGGIAGKALEKTLEPFVNASAKKTAQNISTRIAAYYATRSTDSDSPK
ncbi:SRPBCC family protein [Umezawaea sp. Da 62-37]|uniref:SRPBCC family protein n=1 Tax=Umezawaea sp. Da 62-37 TaxID=3075927 RepID=UPI0028F72A3D|nr:SRPBCC family protein [Umezawaea sp. Da 62-37]WNV85248.1 SRPBCC family protein [Umezawaea sp. Da 62-37]